MNCIMCTLSEFLYCICIVFVFIPYIFCASENSEKFHKTLKPKIGGSFWFEKICTKTTDVLTDKSKPIFSYYCDKIKYVLKATLVQGQTINGAKVYAYLKFQLKIALSYN